MKIFSVIILIIATILLLSWSFHPKRNPNVLLISIDTLRSDALGSYGCQDCKTPNIDKLAKQGILFDNAISVSPWTIPAHFSMFTGLTPSKHAMNIAYSSETIYEKTQPLASSIKTIAEIFNEKGYRCAAFTEGGYMNGRFGYNRGFDIYDDQRKNISDGVTQLIAWLKINKQKKFFAFLHTYSMHFPYKLARHSAQPTQRSELFNLFINKYHKSKKSNTLRTEASNFSEDEVNAIHAGYKYCAEYTDMQLGQLFSYLKSNGLLANTIIILVSDHGEEFYEHKAFLHGHTLYQEQLHIPLIMYLPGNAAGKTYHGLVSNLDIFPTLCSILNENRVSDGISLLDIMKKKNTRTHVFSEATHGVELKSLTTLKYKLILNTRPGEYEYIWKANDLEWQFYDLKNDPNEKNNLAAQNTPEFNQLKEKIGTIMKENSAYHPPATNDSNKTIKLKDIELNKLKSLGYLQ